MAPLLQEAMATQPFWLKTNGCSAEAAAPFQTLLLVLLMRNLRLSRSLLNSQASFASLLRSTYIPLIFLLITGVSRACRPVERVSETNAYVTAEGKVWAHGDIVLGDTALSGMESGVMLENLTPDKDLANPEDRAGMEFE